MSCPWPAIHSPPSSLKISSSSSEWLDLATLTATAGLPPAFCFAEAGTCPLADAPRRDQGSYRRILRYSMSRSASRSSESAVRGQTHHQLGTGYLSPCLGRRTRRIAFANLLKRRTSLTKKVISTSTSGCDPVILPSLPSISSATSSFRGGLARYSVNRSVALSGMSTDMRQKSWLISLLPRSSILIDGTFPDPTGRWPWKF